MIKQLNEQNELTMGIGARYTRLKIPTARVNYYTGMQPYQRLAYERVQREQIYHVSSQLETQLTDKLTSSLGIKALSTLHATIQQSYSRN
ncbi:hypothetical protein [Photobacterium leiognathi]|uniref:hypothetical protein n=1 Tax=Photobacterium leiognathi TaxID=553611 RepID=UPI00273948BF|nr:hypothetical protein [Photobacterium leiognathi]